MGVLLIDIGMNLLKDVNCVGLGATSVLIMTSARRVPNRITGALYVKMIVLDVPDHVIRIPDVLEDATKSII